MEDSALQIDPEYTTRRQRVLIVGGGAVGQVFGLHLQAAGAEIAYFLKPEHAEAAEDGFDLHRYGLSGVRPAKRISKVPIYTDYRRLRGRTFDQVWLCVSSPALRDDVIPLIKDALPNAFWVSLQPGVDDKQYLTWRLQTARIVTGVVNFIAYQAPLPGEELFPEGIAFFVPPLSMTPFTGPEPEVSAVANLLQRGGLTAGVRPDTAAIGRFGSSVLIPFVMALEAMGWSWSDLRASNALLDLVIAAVADAQTAVEKSSGRTSGYFSIAQKRWAWKIALFAVPSLSPFPIEIYFQRHFSKLRAQTDQMAEEFVQHCRDNAIVPRALESLRDQWQARRPEMASDRTLAPGRTDERTPVPSLTHSTGAVPAVLPAPIVDDEDDDVVAVAVVAPIEVDFDFGEGAAAEDAEPAAASSLEEPTNDVADPDDVQPAVVLAIPTTPRAPRPKAEPEPELVEPPVKAPILRSLADLDQVEAIKGPDEPILEVELTPMPKLKPLPFEVEEDDEADEEFEEVHDSLPSIIVDDVLLTDEMPRTAQPTIKDVKTVPAEVRFHDEVSDELKGGLSREDFIQTELANEAQSKSLSDLKSRLRSRLGAKPGLSPALKNDAEDP